MPSVWSYQPDMPSFRDPQGQLWEYDSTAGTYVISQGDPFDHDRSHSTGGDNALFDPAHGQDGSQDGNLFQPKNPMMEGYMARIGNEWASPTEVKCPNCAETTHEHVCPQCGKDLTPEWHNIEDEQIAFDAPPQHHHLDGMPERVPRRNHDHWDDSFPSMISHLRKLGFGGSDEDLINMFTQGPMKTEIGKWLIDRQGQLHYEHGMHSMHDRIALRDGLNWPADIGVTGSVYNDGTAEVLRVYPNYPFDSKQVEPQLAQAFGEGIHLTGPVSAEPAEQKGVVFPPFAIQSGQWLIAPNTVHQPFTGLAWVKERPEGMQYQSNMVFVTEHLAPEDVAGQMPFAVITATGGAASHAAYLASTSGVPVIVGIGPEYNKIETGNYLKIDPSTKTITVIPAATGQSSPQDKHDTWNSILQYQHGVENQMTPQPTFSHIDEELAWKAAHPIAMQDCPDCRAPMMEKNASVFCPDCGHSQHTAGPGPLLAPLAEGLAGGAAGAGAEAGGLGQIGGLMNKALQGGAWQMGKDAVKPDQQQGVTVNNNMGSGPTDDSQTQGVIASSDEDDDSIGTATKNDGQNSDPDQQSSSGDSQKEHGDSPEQLKDVDGIGGPKDSAPVAMHDPALQDKALKAFHMNMPLVIELANSDEAGSENPLIRALDELLETAFPGYKDGTDPSGGTPLDEHPDAPSEDSGESGDNDSDEPKDEPKPKESNYSLWHDGFEIEAAAWGDPTMAPPGGMPGTGQMPEYNSCPICGQVHMPGACPQQQAQQGLAQPQQMQPAPGIQQKVVTHEKNSKWFVIAEVAEHTEHHQHEKHHEHEQQAAGDASDPRGEQQNQWMDDSGMPLTEGADYELRSPNYQIPDRITVTNVLPEKLIFTIHSGDVDYQDQINKQDVANEGYTFGPVVDGSQNDSEDGFPATQGPQEAPVRPGADSGAQVDDLSSPATVMSSLENYEGSYEGDTPDARAHILDGASGGGVEVDPSVLAQVMGTEMAAAGGSRQPMTRQAGKDYSPREQREFIDESGTARNLDQLNLAGTHYIEDDGVDIAFNW